MKTLFAKIFLWFFGAQVLIGVAMFAVGFAGSDEGTPAPVRQMLADELRLASASAVLLARHGQLAQGSAGNTRTRIFWRPVRGELRFAGRGAPTPQERELAARALATSGFIWSGAGQAWGGALASDVGDGQKVVVVREMGRRSRSPWGFLNDFNRRDGRVRFAVAFGLMGLVCFGLARYLTMPVQRLRRATHRLREGDLSARVGFKTRGDELSSLGHDFDAMAARLEESAATERRLLGDISHELRSPLARLSVALDLVEQNRARAEKVGETVPEAKYLAALERIRRESGVLNELIGQLLELSRLEALARDGLGVSNKERVHLETLVRDVVADAQFEAKPRARDVVIIQSEECVLAGAPLLLRSAVENVIRNAVRYTRENTRVEVRLCRVENEALLSVRDFGPGVPEESLDCLFRPFYRVSSGRDRESGGVGLGLSIAERALRIHGATIEASNAQGGGLRVEIRVPLEQHNSTKAPVAALEM